MKVDERVMAMSILIAYRLNVGDVDAVDWRMRAVGSSERIGHAPVSQRILPHVFRIHAPRHAIRPCPGLIVELIADSTRAVRSDCRRREHAAIPEDLTRIGLAFERIGPRHDVLEPADELREPREVDAVAV